MQSTCPETSLIKYYKTLLYQKMSILYYDMIYADNERADFIIKKLLIFIKLIKSNSVLPKN